MKSFGTLLKNQLKLSLRDMNMVIFAVAMPLVVLIIIGVIYGCKPAAAGVSYTFLEQSMGALCAIAICAGGLMGLPLAIADSRERKVLKRFKVTPVSPVMILIVYLAMYIVYCAISVVTLLLAGAIFWKTKIYGNVFAFLGSWIVTMMSTLSVGLMVGGIAKNSKIAGVISSLLYFPMLVFSGTTLPFEVMPKGMQFVVRFFPITQGIELMKTTYLGLPAGEVTVPLLVMGAVTAVSVTVAVKGFRWE